MVGDPPLHLACSRGSMGAASLLLDNGANIDLTDKSNYNIIHKLDIFECKGFTKHHAVRIVITFISYHHYLTTPTPRPLAITNLARHPASYTQQYFARKKQSGRLGTRLHRHHHELITPSPQPTSNVYTIITFIISPQLLSHTA